MSKNSKVCRPSSRHSKQSEPPSTIQKHPGHDSQSEPKTELNLVEEVERLQGFTQMILAESIKGIEVVTDTGKVSAVRMPELTLKAVATEGRLIELKGRLTGKINAGETPLPTTLTFQQIQLILARQTK